VPPFEVEKLTASSVILADDMQPVATREVGLGQFVIGSTRVRPKLDKTFRSDQPMGIYLQAYGLKVDETTHRNSATVEVEITQDEKTVIQARQTAAEMEQNGEQVTLEKVLPGGSLQPGKYKLHIRVTDTLANQTLTRCGGGSCSVDFTVTEAPVRASQVSTGR
jgi:hypothetical protein